jgi:hypothetical protein
MAETAALLADEVLPDVPLRQWVISFPFPVCGEWFFSGSMSEKGCRSVYRTNKAHVDCTTAANAPGYITPDDAPLTAVGRYGLKSYSP